MRVKLTMQHQGAVLTLSPEGPVVEYGQCSAPLSAAVAYAMVENVALPLDIVEWLESEPVAYWLKRWTEGEA